MAKFNFAKKFNTERQFTVDTSSFDYFNISDIYESEEEVYPVRGVYINTKSKYGPHPTIALNDRYVNLPQHMYDACQEILADPAAIKAINEGHVGISFRKYYQPRYARDCYSAVWVDLD